MGQIEDLQAKGFGADGGKQYTVDNDITPLKKRVLVSHMQFGETKSKGGIILMDDDGSAGGIHPRWAKVYATGPKQKDVKVGDWILLEHGRWSLGQDLDIEGEDKLRIWLADHEAILAVSDALPE